MAIFKTSAKFDKTVRDIKDSLYDFYIRHKYQIQVGMAIAGPVAVAIVWEQVGEKIGYNIGYAQGTIDMMAAGIKQGWFKNEFIAQ